MLERGHDYTALERVVCIVFLDAVVGDRFHARYAIRETTDHSRFGSEDLLELHVVELPRPDDAGAWAELDSLAEEHPIMAQAKEALERLSADPAAQALYEAHLKGRMFLQVVREEGREEGRAVTLREAIGWLCDSYAIPIDDALRARLTAATVPELEALADTLRRTRALPPA